MNPEDLDHELQRARSYDDVAEAYERINAPLFFEEPARAMVSIGEISRGQRVLDVGAGTGAVSRAALAVGAELVAVDPSVPMLDSARRSGVSSVVAGSLPGLPFVDAFFDRVCSAFVLTHVDDPDAAVREMNRVLRAGGRVVLSAWSAADDDYSRAWSAVTREFVDARQIEDAALRVLPGEARFSQRDGLRDLLAANGFARARTVVRPLRFALTLDQMIETREVNASGRAVRALLPEARWLAFQNRVREVLGNKFPGGVRYEREVFFAVGYRA